MCHEQSYESMMKVTGSSNWGHGVCCKSNYDGKHCNEETGHKCSMASFDDNLKSKWADVVTTPVMMNHQMFAYCPGIN